jgi:type II secretory pathway component PulM
MNQLDNLNFWYKNLQPRERLLVVITSVILLITIFYISIWEPIYGGLDEQQKLHKSQQNTLLWMQQASAEVKALKRSGVNTNIKSSNQPVSLVIEQSASTAGLKKNLSKLESSGKAGAQAKLEMASFDQMLIWINTLKRNYNINITSANIERADKPGTVNARLTFSR